MNAETRRRYDAARQRDGRNAAYLVDRLKGGHRILNYGKHHYAMAALKAALGDPRPQGMTLSLTNPTSASAYWGYYHRNGTRVSYRLSTNPDDYVWESDGDNKRRGHPARGGTNAEVPTHSHVYDPNPGNTSESGR